MLKAIRQAIFGAKEEYKGPVIEMDDLHRIEPTTGEKEQAQKSTYLEDISEGRSAYENGGDLRGFRMAQRADRWTYPRHEHIDQLCGYIEALADQVAKLVKVSNTTIVLAELTDEQTATFKEQMKKHREKYGAVIWDDSRPTYNFSEGPKIKGAYYVVEGRPIFGQDKASLQVWKWNGTAWYAPGDEQEIPENWATRVIRKIRLEE